MVIIVTGAIGIGKTTICEKVIEIARSQRYSCGGIITYKTRNKDIIIRDVQTGKTEALASTRKIYQGPRTAKYFFNPEGIDFGIQAIDRGAASDILCVDEIGYLELKGEGFAKVPEIVGTERLKNSILVIRKELLPAFLPRLGLRASIIETTIHNRSGLPQKICTLLDFGNTR
jgi:nucleoside-triphosphatase THEP1